MKDFMGEDFLLQSETAKELYERFAKDAPIIDYHCHIDPKEIFEDRRSENITQLWLGEGGSLRGDHYKWRLMRSCGVEEKYITGNAPDEERFQKWAECLEGAVGNPLYHWSHMELKKYFGFEGVLCRENAKEVFALCAEKLKAPEMSPRGLILQSGVKLICTTDDPADSLQWHKKLREDESFFAAVLPAFRPDRAKNIENPGWVDYMAQLSEASGMEIGSFDALKSALIKRMDAFAALGCKVSDHGMESMEYAPAHESEISLIFKKALRREFVSAEDAAKFHTALLLFLGGEYARRGWVMQLHYGAKRNNNSAAFEKMGADTGYDCIFSTPSSAKLADFLNALEKDGSLPKTIVYNLDPCENAAVDSIIGCFQNSSAVGKLQHGSAWWFCDNLRGIRSQLCSLAEQGSLAGFVGMLTDSRSLLSYTRHDYFRRILCDLIGGWVEQGLYPADFAALGHIIGDICYYNALSYFGFEAEIK